MKFRIVICVLLAFSSLAFFSGCAAAPEESLPATVSATETTPLSSDLTVIKETEIGQIDSWDYELWKDRGDTEMTLEGDGTFTCRWSDISNALFRTGKKFDCTQTWEEIGNITITYGADYFPVGNSYLCVYGWSREPLVEYYVVQSWGNWRPPGAESLGTITVDDATYDVYCTTRVNQPSIDGTQTFQQFWSVRKGKCSEGTVSLTEHFKAWESMGLELGNLYEAALTIEGYQSSGYAKIYQNEISIDVDE